MVFGAGRAYVGGMDPNDFNQQVIDEFRANDGKVGGPFEGADLLLLHHRGAKTGTERVSPLMYRRDGDAYIIFGSKAGADTDPDWLHNLRANADTSIEVGSGTVDVTADELAGDERDRLWTLQTTEVPQFAEYERSTSRTIPVIALRPR